MSGFFQFGDFGFQQAASVAAGGGGGAGGDDLAAITKTITLTELNALGATQTGYINFGSALPAGAIPLALLCEFLQSSVLTSSGGTPTGMAHGLVVSGQTSRLAAGGATRGFGDGANADRGQLGVFQDSARTSAQYPYGDSTTYAIELKVSGTGVTHANLTGPSGNVIQATLVYYDPTA